MSLVKENYKALVNYIKNELKNEKWNHIICEIFFHEKGSYGNSVKYSFKDDIFDYVTNAFEVIPILRKIFAEFLDGRKKRDFNRVIITIKKEDYSVTYEMDNEKIIEGKQKSALIFPNYLYEKMRSQIYEYEVKNNLRTPIYDEEGEVCDYEDSWDNGVFTFVVDINSKTIHHTIELFKDGVKRIVPLKLLDFFKEAIFTHYEHTHGVLKENWEPWNKIVLTAPKDFIPLGKEQEYIKYSLHDLSNEI